MLHLILLRLPKLKVKYVLKYFDQHFNHPTAKEFSTLNLNEKGFFLKKKKKETWKSEKLSFVMVDV